MTKYMYLLSGPISFFTVFIGHFLLTTTLPYTEAEVALYYAHWDLGEIDGLLVPPGKAYLLTDQLITGSPLRSEPAKEVV